MRSVPVTERCVDCRIPVAEIEALGFGVVLWSADGRRDLRVGAGVLRVEAPALGNVAEASDMGGDGGTSA